MRYFNYWPTALVSFLCASLVTLQAVAEESEETKKPTVMDYRDRALRTEGDAARGRAIFDDKRALCSQCHSTDGSASKAGPELYAAGDKFSRADLIRSVLEPSASIMMGYATTLVETKEGKQYAGIVKSVSESELVLANAGDVVHRIAKAEIKEQQTSPASLMPEGLYAALSVEEFTDLIVYLESLKQPETQLANTQGTPGVIQQLSKPVALQPINSERHRFEKPVWIGEHPVLDGAFIVAELWSASLWLFEKKDDGDSKELFVTVEDEVFVSEFEGLLGFAFHPEFKENRKYYFMHEIKEGTQRAMVIAERQAREDLRADSGRPTRRVLQFDAKTEVHHGGGIAFGPDGYLYIGMGDSGPQEDPLGHGQDRTDLFGNLLRIDVDSRDPGLEYAIPPDNPFVDDENPKVRREIFAYGLRQPWRFSWDSANGDMWVGEVGQNRFEEICIVRPGENHGWNVYEGFELFSTQYRKKDAQFVQPVVSFQRRHSVSITGGYVYRGDPGSSFNGVYICGSYEKKQLWGITQRDRKLQAIREIGTSPDRIVSFGRDRSGDLYVIGYDQGIIYKIDFHDAVFD